MSSLQSPLPNLTEPSLPQPTTTENLANPFSKAQVRTSGCPYSNNARNLVVCIDGTANQFSAKSTNIIELFSRLVKDEEGQLAFYNSGIGTYAKPSFRSFGYLKQVVYHTIDMAIAWNFERIVHAAYEWLSENYLPGDRIYLFGFSRGAYQVRVIAGMIHKVGLLHKGNKNQIPFAYELYASITERTKRESEVSPSDATSSNNTQGQPDAHAQLRDVDIESDHKLCSQFKATLCRKDVKVHFVGAWDTVSSIGILRGKSLPETVSGMGHVCAFRHALALDERRVKFQPEYANGGLGPERGDRGDVKEVWFAGSHSDIGGGNVTNEDLSNFGPALRWMTYEAMTYGLRMNPYEGQWTTVVSKPSLTGVWHFLELLPFPCLSYEGRDTLTFSPHLELMRLLSRQTFRLETVVLILVLKLKMQTVLEKRPSMAVTTLCPPHPPTQGVDLTPLDNGTTFSEPSSEVELTEKIPGAFPKTPTSPPSEPLSLFPSAILPTTNERNLAWEDLFKSYKNELIVEKDPFEDVSHTLDTLETICKALERRLQDEGDEEPIDFNPFTAAIITLRSFLDDASRLPSFTEVPNAATILLSALKLAHEHHYLDVETRRTILRLILHARAIEVIGDRKFTTLEIQEWVEPFRDEFSSVPLTSGNPCLQSQPFQGIPKPIHFNSTSHPGRVILASMDNTKVAGAHVRLWDTSSMQLPIAQTSLSGSQTFISKNGSLVAVASQGNLCIFNLDVNMEEPEAILAEPANVNKPRRKESKHRAEDPIDVCFSDDDRLLARHARGFIEVWRKDGPPPRWAMVHQIKVRDSSPISSLVFSSTDYSKLAYIGTTSSLAIRDLAEPLLGQQEIIMKASSDTYALISSPSREWLVSAHRWGTVKIWSVEKMSMIHNFLTRDGFLTSLAFRPDGKAFATGSTHRIQVWSCNSWARIFEFDVVATLVSLGFSPDGKRLVSGARDVVQLWDVATGDFSSEEDDTERVMDTKDVKPNVITGDMFDFRRRRKAR
ncbi:hypothetical protein ONZ45_g7778 [Pleurotus djamor]|nr:hypothetical protein ONZ45_g7778 [Pleurotus djamor]